jgi:flavin reductase (DIM6/NTAB) family NADH-FMN oxidoreductase RutF
MSGSSFRELDPHDRYKLLCGVVVPRPIALVTTLLVGEVLRLHAREGLIDRERMHVDFDVYRPIGRLFGNLYAAQRDTFALTRESHEQWLARGGAAETSDQSQ